MELEQSTAALKGSVENARDEATCMQETDTATMVSSTGTALEDADKSDQEGRSCRQCERPSLKTKHTCGLRNSSAGGKLKKTQTEPRNQAKARAEHTSDNTKPKPAVDVCGSGGSSQQLQSDHSLLSTTTSRSCAQQPALQQKQHENQQQQQPQQHEEEEPQPQQQQNTKTKTKKKAGLSSWNHHAGWTYKKGNRLIEFFYYAPDGTEFTVYEEALAYERGNPSNATIQVVAALALEQQTADLPAMNIKVSERVDVYWPGDKQWYSAEVVEISLKEIVVP